MYGSEPCLLGPISPDLVVIDSQYINENIITPKPDNAKANITCGTTQRLWDGPESVAIAKIIMPTNIVGPTTLNNNQRITANRPDRPTSWNRRTVIVKVGISRMISGITNVPSRRLASELKRIHHQYSERVDRPLKLEKFLNPLEIAPTKLVDLAISLVIDEATGKAQLVQ
jgi:hypothetical protein